MAVFIDGQEILTLNVDGTLIETISIDDVTVARKPAITTQPVGGTIIAGESISLSVVADGLDSSLSYQWYKSDNTAIAGANTAVYTFSSSERGSFAFYCRVMGFGGVTQTDTITVEVGADSTNHVLTVGYFHKVISDVELIETYGYFPSETPMGGFQPLLTDTGDYCIAFTAELLFGGDVTSGSPYASEMLFNGEVKQGKIYITIEGYGEISGTPAQANDEGEEPFYAIGWDNTTSQSLYNFFKEHNGANINVTVRYEPS